MTNAPAISPDAPIDADLPCVNCRYNLRTLFPTSLCPECAHPVADSLRRGPGVFPRPRVASFAFLLLSCGYLLAGLSCSLWWLLFDPERGGPLSWANGLNGGLAAGALLQAAAVLLLLARSVRPRTVRRLPAWTLLFSKTAALLLICFQLATVLINNAHLTIVYYLHTAALSPSLQLFHAPALTSMYLLGNLSAHHCFFLRPWFFFFHMLVERTLECLFLVPWTFFLLHIAACLRAGTLRRAALFSFGPAALFAAFLLGLAAFLAYDFNHPLLHRYFDFYLSPKSQLILPTWGLLQIALAIPATLFAFSLYRQSHRPTS